MKRVNDSFKWHLNELTSRIVAKSGVPSDRYHLGKMILQSLKDDPELVAQIDGATGKSETSASVLQRSVRCAVALQNVGLKRGDVMVLMAPNHIDVAIPLYAALYLGIIVAAVDRNLAIQEKIHTFDINRPSVIFCQCDLAKELQQILDELQLKAKIVTFDESEHFTTFQELLDHSSDQTAVEDFTPENFDTEDTIAMLLATSGTTGKPKAIAITHKNFAIDSPFIYTSFFEFPMPTRMALVPSPLQWLTAIMQFILTPIMRVQRLQTSHSVMTKEHMYDMINTYKPTYLIISPIQMTSLIKPGDREACDFSCLEYVSMAGSSVSQELVEEIRGLVAPGAHIVDNYGMSELCSPAFMGDGTAPGSCGKPMGCFQYRLIDIETQKDIVEPNSSGELWVKGPGIFKEYYRNTPATEETFAEDRWFKTGDLFYRDENWNYYFVERIKLLLKYRSNYVSPVELEGIIRKYPGVMDVAVTGIPHPELGDLPVACVVREPGYILTAQDIKDMIAAEVEKGIINDAKKLRGGVIFLDRIPMTSSSKILRQKIKELALTMKKE